MGDSLIQSSLGRSFVKIALTQATEISIFVHQLSLVTKFLTPEIFTKNTLIKLRNVMMKTPKI